MSHWYDDKGKQHYGAGLKEARENGYLPSVTTILKTIASPGLEQYKQNQMFEAVIEAQAENFLYTDAELKKRAFEISKLHARKAAQLGTVVHYMIADYLQGKPVHRLQSNKPQWVFAPVRDWIDENVSIIRAVESVVVNNDLGYAGKSDLDCELKSGPTAIIDWKTQAIPPKYMKKDGQPQKNRWYDTWLMQLVALERTSLEDCVLLSVMIGTHPENYGCWVRQWTREEKAQAWECFKAALTIWRIKNKMPQRVLM